MQRFTFFIFFLLMYLYSTAQDITGIINSNLSNEQKADSVFTLARGMVRKGKSDSAIQILQKAKPFVLEKGNALTKSRYFGMLGQFLFLKNNYKHSLNELKISVSFFDQHNNLSLKGYCYYFLARCYLRLNQQDSAHIYFTESEKAYLAADPYKCWQVYAEMGELFKSIRNFSVAEDYFLKAYKLTKEKGVRMDHAVMLNYITSFYSHCKNSEKYSFYLKEKIEFYSKSKPSQMLNPVHNFIFADLDKLSNDEKIIFLNNVKASLLLNGEKMNAAFVSGIISLIYEKDNHPELSLPYMRESVTLTATNDDLSNHLVYSKSLFRLMMKTGNIEEAIKQSDYLFIITDSISNRQRQVKIQELESKYHSIKQQQEIDLLSSKNKLNSKQIELLKVQALSDSIQLLREVDKRKALFAQNLLKEMNLDEQQKNVQLLLQKNTLMDSVVKSEQAYSYLLATENNIKEEKLKKEKELKQALARENLLQANHVKKERQAKWMLFGGAVLFLLSGLIIFSLYQKQKKKNVLIQKQANELEVLMQEIHHRVKNNLQVVSSLLDLQSHSISNVQAHEAVKEGKNRVQSMALIHQNLYSEGNIKSIKLKEYVTNLVQTLSDSYNINSNKVKINLDIADLNLDVDTMIPLGLLLNELISNSFKYAFKQIKNGELSILLLEKTNQLHLKVQDNGHGFPADLNLNSGKSFGMKMIRAFAQKLKAKLEIYNSNGAVIEMYISKFKTA